MTTDTKLKELVINKLTKKQYDSIEEKDPNQLYILTDAPGFEESRTNCITEIPQDIKLELSDGTLTLKAGSKVYVPNGAGKFDVVTIESDKTASYGHNGPDFVWYHENGIDLLPLSLVFSGSTAPSGNQYMLWYDTTNNQIKYTNNSGESWSAEQSFPLGVIATSSSAPTSIDQVFNGFGYIGSTVFALPGVKGLIPDGRNADGSLKNIEVVLGKVGVRSDINPNVSGFFALNGIVDGFLDWGVSYELTDDNYLNTSYGDKVSNVVSGLFVTDSSGKITSFNPKTTFHALDYNDRPTITYWE